MNNRIRNIISESLHKRLLEYAQPSFNFNDFNNAIHQGYSALLDYCNQTLEPAVGKGTSRAVFDYDDDTVLKVAIKDFGRTQNENEFETFKTLKGNPLIPKIYDADTESFIWLLSEAVLPAKTEDFQKILGIPYMTSNELEKDFHFTAPEDKWDYSEYENQKELITHAEDENEISYMSFLAWYADYQNDYLYDWSEEECDFYQSLLMRPWFQNLIELFEFQSPDEFILENFGIVMRDGKPMIVVLDMGWNE